MDFKVDWLTLTLKPVSDNVKYDDMHFLGDLNHLEKWCFNFLGLTEYIGSFKKKIGSVQHYNVMYSYSGIDIALSTPDRFAEQGLMFRFSGTGLSFFEKHRKLENADFTIITFLKEFFSLGLYGLDCRCTRIDLAFDDISYNNKDRLIDLRVIDTALARGEFVSLFRKDKPYKDYPMLEARRVCERKKGHVVGDTIYLGNRKSKVFLRFYDKLAEAIEKKEPYDDKITHWVRMEFEFKSSRAMSVCDSLITLSPEQFGEYMGKVSNRYVRFVVPHGDKEHYYRCASRKWWKDIVGTVEKARLVENKAYRNKFNSTLKWLRRQVFPSIYAILHCLKVDDFLTDVRDTGRERVAKYGDNTVNVINDFLNNTPSDCFKGIDIHRGSTDDYISVLRELEAVAFGTSMRAKGYELCVALSLQEEYKRFHRVRPEGTLSMTIQDFKTRKQLELEDFPFNDVV